METKIAILNIKVTVFLRLIAFVDGSCSPNCGDLPVNTTGTACNETTEECLYGCKGNFTGDYCDTCLREWTGDQCQFKCDYNCDNCTWANDSDGRVQIGCDLCRPGYFHTSKKCEFCYEGCMGNSTSNLPRCDQSNGSCTFGCEIDWYGSRCSDPCPELCVNRSCSRTGGCCSAGCRNPQFGGCQCVEPCSSNCLNGTCYQNKTCRLGCKTNYWGSSCHQSCSTTCYNTTDNSTSCDMSGNCVFGCKKSYMGAQCEKRCNEACLDQDCHQDSGICVRGCNKGYYGQLCNQTCDSNCYETDCYPSNGTCKSCHAGFYGLFCATRCPENCMNRVCSEDDGLCLEGCVKGMTGPQCDEVKPKVSTEDKTFLHSILDPALYAFAGLAGLVLVGIVLFILWKRRKINHFETKNENSHTQEIGYENLEMPTAKGKSRTEAMDSTRKYTGEQYEEVAIGHKGSIHLYEGVERNSTAKSEFTQQQKRLSVSYKKLQEQDVISDRPVNGDNRVIGDHSIIAGESLQSANLEKGFQNQENAGVHIEAKETSAENQSIITVNKDIDALYENLDLRRKSKIKVRNK